MELRGQVRSQMELGTREGFTQRRKGRKGKAGDGGRASHGGTEGRKGTLGSGAVERVKVRGH